MDGKNTTANQENTNPDEFSFSVGPTLEWMKKHSKYLLVLLVLILVFHLRMTPKYLPQTDVWAKSSVDNAILSDIRSNINTQYPNLPQKRKDSLVAEQFEKQYVEREDEINALVIRYSNQLKEGIQYEENGATHTYLGDIDSYYYLRQARNLLEKGTICDLKEEGKCYDTYTMAPLKTELTPSLHPHSIVAVYKTIRFFMPSITLMDASFYTPLLFSLFSAFVFYLLITYYVGPVGGLFGSVLLSVNPVYLSRSLGSDTDVYNVFFPVLIVGTIVMAIIAGTEKKIILWSVLAGILFSLYSFAWTGWWYLFDFILAALIAEVIILSILRFYHKQNLHPVVLIRDPLYRRAIIAFGVIFVTTLIGVTIISGFGEFRVSYSGFVRFMSVKSAANVNVWPNVLNTVAEFNPASLQTIIGNSGGKRYFLISLLGLLFLIWDKVKYIKKHLVIFGASVGLYLYLLTDRALSMDPLYYLILLGIPVAVSLGIKVFKEEESNAVLSIFFLLWILASIYASIKGVRFILLLAAPLSFAGGIAIGFLHQKLSQTLSVQFRIPSSVTTVCVGILFLLLLITPVRVGYGVATNYIPNVNDGWVASLSKIKENSQSDAIINSWWDFGHWFKYLANRRVTLDGASQNNPQLHWLGKALSTNNETVALGVLRMLDCGGNEAFNSLNQDVNNSPLSIKILNEIIALPKQDAESHLAAYNIPGDVREQVLHYSHCSPPENFFITSEDMVGKAGVWAHFGGWDFEKAAMQQVIRRSGQSRDQILAILANDFNKSPAQAESLYNEVSAIKAESDINTWISPWPAYVGVTGCRMPTVNGSIVICPFYQETELTVDLSTNDASISLPQGKVYPNGFGYVKSGVLTTKYYTQNTIGMSGTLFGEPGNYRLVVSSPQLFDSMFTRLYFLGGVDTPHFEVFDQRRDTSGQQIIVWKVKWD